MRCWLCHVEPDEVYKAVAMDRDGTVTTFARWPAASDHEHAVMPPTPSALAEAGNAALSRIMQEWIR